MKTREFSHENLALKEDWEGNNIALECPVCGKVYIVSEMIHGERACPSCGKSRGAVKGGRKSGGKAWVSWDE
jgi:rubrerythrin